MVEFKTKLVKAIPETPAGKKAAAIGIIGAVVALCAVPFSVYKNTLFITNYLFIAGLVIIIIAVIIGRGKVSGYEIVQDEIILRPEEIIVDGKTFFLKEITQTKILAHAFNGMYIPVDKFKNSRRRHNGMSNQVSFEYNGIKYQYLFYVNSAKHMYILGEVLTEWYKHHYTFTEYGIFGRTYLFKYLDEQGLEQFKAKYNLS
jgi:hypothetical protein